MPVFSLHEHKLKSTASHEQYEQEVTATLKQMNIPGLQQAYLLKGFKGERDSLYAVLWIFDNKQSIEDVFGTLDNPKWPKDWLYYENEILAKYLVCHPDKINFTDYGVVYEIDYTG